MNLFICICASNRPFLLKRTLYSLSKLYKPSHVNVHVVIIDNNIYSNNRSIIKKFNNKSFFKLIYKYELKKGIVNSSSSARTLQIWPTRANSEGKTPKTWFTKNIAIINVKTVFFIIFIPSI